MKDIFNDYVYLLYGCRKPVVGCNQVCLRATVFVDACAYTCTCTHRYDSMVDMKSQSYITCDASALVAAHRRKHCPSQIYVENKARAHVATYLNIVPMVGLLLPLAVVVLCSPGITHVTSPSCQRVCGRPILRRVLARPAVTHPHTHTHTL